MGHRLVRISMIKFKKSGWSVNPTGAVSYTDDNVTSCVVGISLIFCIARLRLHIRSPIFVPNERKIRSLLNACSYFSRDFDLNSTSESFHRGVWFSYSDKGFFNSQFVQQCKSDVFRNSFN